MNKAINCLRSIIYLIFLTATVIPYSCICLIAFPFSLNIRYKIITLWPKIAIQSLSLICGVKWKVSGLENIPDNPVIIVSNHQSAWETLFFMSFFPKKICFIYKKELHYVPFFGLGLYLLEMIAINRSKGSSSLKKIINLGAHKMNNNYSIVIFPEGTRSEPGEIKKFKNGAALLAHSTNHNILPIALNTGFFWSKNSIIIKPGIIKISIGPIIKIEGLNPEKINKLAYTWIKNEFNKIDNL